MNEARTVRVLHAAQRYLLLFLSTAFVVTCCMILCHNTMQHSMGASFEKEAIELAAKLTFGNVLLISLLSTVIDAFWRWLHVTRPVRRITAAAEKIMEGNLSVRIEPIRGIDPQDGFNIIIDYFNRMAKELSGMETLRTDFIANVSHELKTPLSVIQNYGTMLQQPDLPEDTRLEYARTVTDASRRLASLITNILKLNKLENQEIYPASEDYDLSEQLCECLLAFEEAWECKNLVIETDIEENITVHADAEMLSLVWNNLFSNAVKFTEPGGKITLTVSSDGPVAIVKVTDTGCGISREAGQHIFEKFYQGDTSHATAGNGLGLALVKRVVDITGGDISVESEVGKGSTFTVKLRRKGPWNNSNES